MRERASFARGSLLPKSSAFFTKYLSIQDQFYPVLLLFTAGSVLANDVD
jgi:hypothetical protein